MYNRNFLILRIDILGLIIFFLLFCFIIFFPVTLFHRFIYTRQHFVIKYDTLLLILYNISYWFRVIFYIILFIILI